VPGGFLNTREVIIEKAKPLLEPGEVVAHVVRAVEGPPRLATMALALVIGIGVAGLIHTPFLAFALVAIIYFSAYQRRVILATDRALVLVGCGRYRFGPRKVLERVDLETHIGPLKGAFLRTELSGRRLYVVPRTAGEVAAADADLEG
jgi:hypothetical protein